MYKAWRSLVSQFGLQKSRSSSAQYHLTEAYRRVFQGQPSKEDQELVLADLRAKSGFDRVLPSTASDTELRQNEGKRELFGHIFGHLTMDNEDLTSLQHAARLEAVADDKFST